MVGSIGGDGAIEKVESCVTKIFEALVEQDTPFHDARDVIDGIVKLFPAPIADGYNEHTEYL